MQSFRDFISGKRIAAHAEDILFPKGNVTTYVELQVEDALAIEKAVRILKSVARNLKIFIRQIMVTYRRFLLLSALTAIICVPSTAPFAASTLVSANMTFMAPLSLSKNSDIQFGYLKALQAGTYVIDTSGSVTASNGGQVIGGTQTSGQITIMGSGTQTISIKASTYTSSPGVTISNATCNYNGTLISNCDAGGTGLPAPPLAGAILKLGVKANVDGTQTPGTTSSSSFIITIIYS